jgi:hypothetical protein
MANVIHMTRFWNKLSYIHSQSKDWKDKLVFEGKKTKGHTQDSQTESW